MAMRDIPTTSVIVDDSFLPLRSVTDPKMVGGLLSALSSGVSLHPILVWSDPEGGEDEYHLLHGRHRLKAALAHSLPMVPAVVYRVPIEEARRLAVTELLRPGRKASPWETSRLVAQIHQAAGGGSLRQLAESVGRSRSSVTRDLRIAEAFPEEDVAGALARAGISEHELYRVTATRLKELADTADLSCQERMDLLVEGMRESVTSRTAAVRQDEVSSQTGLSKAVIIGAVAVLSAICFSAARRPRSSDAGPKSSQKWTVRTLGPLG